MLAARALKTADGHSAEAEAAANEAAREARAEIIEQAGSAKTRRRVRQERADGGAEVCGQGRHAGGQGRSLAPLHRRRIRLTNFNSVEFGFYKRSRNKAKSRQFTTDMDVLPKSSRTASARACSATAKISGKADRLDRAWCSSCSPRIDWRATMDLMLGKTRSRRRSAPAVADHLLLDQHR